MKRILICLVLIAFSGIILLVSSLISTPAAKTPLPPAMNEYPSLIIETASATTTFTTTIASTTMTSTAVPVESSDTNIVTLAATGDLMCHLKNLNAGYNSKTKTFDFTRFFRLVKPYLSQADLTMGNLETVLAGGEKLGDYTGFPLFNSPDEFALALKESGYDLLTTANNHMLDQGFTGLSRTLDVLDDLELLHTGSARTKEEAIAPLITNINGIRFGFLAYTYSMQISRTPSEMKNYALNLYSTSKAVEDIAALKEAGAEAIIVSLHWGPDENVTKPSTKYKNAVQSLVDAGASAIIGHHPHVLQSMEWVISERDGETVSCPVLYSVGNFHCNPALEPNAQSCIAYLTFERNQTTGKVSCSDMSALPVYICRIKTEPRDFILIPIGLALDDEDVYDSLGLNNRKTLNNAWNGILSSLGSQVNIIRK